MYNKQRFIYIRVLLGVISGKYNQPWVITVQFLVIRFFCHHLIDSTICITVLLTYMTMDTRAFGIC